MGWLKTDWKTIAVGSGVFALAVGIAWIQHQRSAGSQDPAGDDPRVAARPVFEKGLGSRTLPSGLIIEDLVIGDGHECGNPLETVTIHYRGMLESGEVFDSSYARAQPIVAPLNGMIRGWQEGVPGMKVGGRRRLTVPSDLSYSGMAAIQPRKLTAPDPGGAVLIPAGATLIFEIELLDVKHTEQAQRD